MWSETKLYCPDCEIELETVFHDGLIYHKCPACGYEVINNYHVAVELWVEYLEVINMILSAKGIADVSIAVLDYKRQEIHNKLIELYKKDLKNFDIDWFNDVCHALDKYIDINGDIEKKCRSDGQLYNKAKTKAGSFVDYESLDDNVRYLRSTSI